MSCTRGFFDNFLGYESARFILIKNWKLAITFRILQLGVIAYIIVFQIVIKQGYQEYDQLVGTTSTKVKGTASVGTLGTSSFQMYDVYDLIPNPVEKDALFITTNYFPTPSQTRSTCIGNDGTEACSNTKPCVPGTYTVNGVISDSTCNFPSNSSSTKGFCNIYSWCPLEDGSIKFPNKYIMSGSLSNWTIYLKVNVEFPHFDVTLSNTFNTSLPDRGLRPLLNLFSVDQILSAAGTSYDNVAQFGTIVLGQIQFDCNLNSGLSSCVPTFLWSRLDTDSPGFNYRYITTAPSSNQRDLNKVFGIRLLFNLNGIAGRFSMVPLLIAIGSGVGLLSVATLVCDFVLQKFLPDKDRYLAEKFHHVAETGIPEFSAGDVLAINELANTRHMNMNNVHTNGDDGSFQQFGLNSPYRLMKQQP